MNTIMISGFSVDRLATLRMSCGKFADNFQIKQVLINGCVEMLVANLESESVNILLLDLTSSDLKSTLNIATLKKLCTRTKVIVLGCDISEDMEWKYLKAGIRGCCKNDIEAELLKQVVESVDRGELWIRRTLTSRLIDELGKAGINMKAQQSALGLLSKLTQREYDIAVRVGKGECNKQIAHECHITERTVKAHLTEIFIKMGVADRLNLALILASENRAYRSDKESPFKNGSRIYELQTATSKKDVLSRLVA